MSTALSPEIQKIQAAVVGMYSEVPWPTTRETDEEMGWRLKCLGIIPEDYKGKRVLEMGCGTGQYALWYAKNGAGAVTAIDLADGALTVAERRKAEAGLQNIEFQKMDILNCTLPDNYFDYSYSVGVLHHTGDPRRGFEHLVRVTKPGGVVIVSLYSSYGRRLLYTKQSLCKLLGGDDVHKRVWWGQKLFGRTLRKMDQRYHSLNTKEVAYDTFGCPHESLHTATEVLRWLDRSNVAYKGAFAPLRLRDYLYVFSQPEYHKFRQTFAGFPIMRFIADAMYEVAKRWGGGDEMIRTFPRPSRLSSVLCQMMWIPFDPRFSCFTIAGIKQG